MTKLSLNQAIQETEKVVSKMPGKRWPIHARLADLVEEVGELANAIQVEEKFKSKKRKRSEIVDSVCDVLFSILLVAKHYKVNLDEEYPKVLKAIKKRIDAGEFDH